MTALEYQPKCLTDVGETAHMFPYPAGMANLQPLEVNGHSDVIIYLDEKYENLPIIGDLMLQSEGAWGYKCGQCAKLHSVMGKSLLVGREFKATEEGVEKGFLTDPHMTIEEVRKFVKWANIIHLNKEESMEYLESGKLPERVDPAQGEVIPADAMVEAAMEMARIATKH